MIIICVFRQLFSARTATGCTHCRRRRRDYSPHPAPPVHRMILSVGRRGSSSLYGTIVLIHLRTHLNTHHAVHGVESYIMGTVPGKTERLLTPAKSRGHGRFQGNYQYAFVGRLVVNVYCENTEIFVCKVIAIPQRSKVYIGFSVKLFNGAYSPGPMFFSESRHKVCSPKLSVRIAWYGIEKRVSTNECVYLYAQLFLIVNFLIFLKF